MAIDFYASRTQPIIGPVVMLPQAGSVTGGSKRPLNSYAILRDGYSILFDAPFSWALDGIERLADGGHPPKALVISHRDLAASGDAYAQLRSRFGLRPMLHRDDQASDKARDAGLEWLDPTAGESAATLSRAAIDVIHVPGHSPGSIVLYIADEGGILLAGDSAVGPGPEQADRTARLQRPIGADKDPRFLDAWEKLVDRVALAAVLPLHGEAYSRAEHADDFDTIVAGIWAGEPMDPRRA